MVNESSIDEILRNAESLGIMWDIDGRDEPIVRYRFVFAEEDAQKIVTSLISRLADPQNRGIKAGWSSVKDKSYYATFGGDISVYLLGPDSPSSAKKDDTRLDHGKSLLVIDTLRRESDYEAKVSGVLNAFYSAHSEFIRVKTPSETSQAHSPCQNP
mgnify:CR=1 FL=1